MKWYSKLYIGESIYNKSHKIKWKINHNKITLNIYVISLPSNPDNLLDIIQANELLQKGYPKKDLHIIGLAKGYDEALALVQTIIEESYSNTGAFNIKEYLKIKEGD